MMGARERILQAIEGGLGGNRQTPGEIAAAAAELLVSPEQIRPRLSDKPLASLFTEKILMPHMGATLDSIGPLSELPDAVRRYLSTYALPPSIALQPTIALTALDWSGIETHATLAPNETVGVALARWGIAETGSLVFHSASDAPTLLSFLPLHHIVALDTRSILAYLEDYAEAVKSGPASSDVNLVTGASGTTDIEGSYVRGAHGPRFLHVILFGVLT